MMYINLEEVVKFQQELLNQQRHQKEIQKETMKLVSLLNKSINIMSQRLDEFAQRTNISLSDVDLQKSIDDASLLLHSSIRLLEKQRGTNNLVESIESDDMQTIVNESDEEEKETFQVKKKPKVL